MIVQSTRFSHGSLKSYGWWNWTVKNVHYIQYILKCERVVSNAAILCKLFELTLGAMISTFDTLDSFLEQIPLKFTLFTQMLNIHRPPTWIQHHQYRNRTSLIPISVSPSLTLANICIQRHRDWISSTTQDYKSASIAALPVPKNCFKTDPF